MTPFSAPGLSEADRSAADSFFDAIVEGRDQDAIALMAPEAINGREAEAFEQIRRYLPHEPQTDARVSSWSINVQTNRPTALTIVQERAYPSHVARAQTVLTRTDNASPWRVYSFNIRVERKADLRPPTISIIGKPWSYAAFVIAAMIVPLFIAVTAAFNLLRKSQPRRWLWLLFILLGFTGFTMNAATGDATFQLLLVALLGAGATWSGSAFDPWIVTLSLPIGAFAYWAYRAGDLPTPDQSEPPPLLKNT